jgi:hypothetical protein
MRKQKVKVEGGKTYEYLLIAPEDGESSISHRDRRDFEEQKGKIAERRNIYTGPALGLNEEYSRIGPLLVYHQALQVITRH